jgi:CBS domain containing-hemolysin-like protein
MSSFLLIFSTIVVLVGLNGLYVAAEFATVASRKTRIRQMAGEGNSMAQMLLPIMEDSKALDRYVAACQIGITTTSLVLGAFSQNYMAGLFTPWLESRLGNGFAFIEGLNNQLGTEFTAGGLSADLLATLLILFFITTIQVVLGELFPKSLAIQFPEQIALSLTIPMRISLILFSPFIMFFNGSGILLLRALGQEHHEGHGHIHSAQEIELLVSESHQSGLLDAEEQQMLRNAFRLRDLTAKEIMVHRTKIISAPVATPAEGLLNRAIKAGKSRIPLYEDNIDNIKGFVHIKDVFRLYSSGQSSLQPIMRDVLHVPESLPVLEVWETLQETGQYMCIVFDEFGGTAGMLTQEDLIEEIFGELQDESDNEKALMYIGKHGHRRLRGDLLVSDVNEYLELELPEDDAYTLSGLVLSELGRPAQRGDEIILGDTIIRVETMEELGVGEVSIHNPNFETKTVHIQEWQANYDTRNL